MKLQIAEVTSKPHNDVMKAIRKMEPAWAKIAQGNFSLGSYKDANGQMRPCYMLTKVECLYIATYDFNELLIEKNRYGAIWLHFAVRPKNNRRKVAFVNA